MTADHSVREASRFGHSITVRGSSANSLMVAAHGHCSWNGFGFDQVAVSAENVLLASVVSSAFGIVAMVWDFLIASASRPARGKPIISLCALVLVGLGAFVGLFATGNWEQSSSLPEGRREYSSTTVNTAELPASNPTYDYWIGLKAALQAIGQTEGRAGASAGPVVKQLQSNAQACQQSASNISALPTLGVDPQAVELGANYIQLFGDTSRELARMANIAVQRQQLQEHAGSAEAFFESFLRGFLGDPLGKISDLQRLDQEIDDELKQAMQRCRTLLERSTQLEAESHKLRAKLSSLHQREFPNLD